MVYGYEFNRPAPGSQPSHLHPPYLTSYSPFACKAPRPHSANSLGNDRPRFPPSHSHTGRRRSHRQHAGVPLGQRIVVSGKVLDESGRPLRQTLIEIWQANAAGRYLHEKDQHNAPLDPNFTGCGQLLTDEEGRYKFVTIRPGEYPWRNHYNAWRPAHIHFSLFGSAFATRLVTQMYFPGDPLLAQDPIFNCVATKMRAIASYPPSIGIPLFPIKRLVIALILFCAVAKRLPLSPDLEHCT